MENIMDLFAGFMGFLASDETMTVLVLAITIGVSIIVGVLAGNSAVVVFNRMPARWLCDYNQEPSEELKSMDSQRIKSHPWKVVFSVFFVVCALAMATDDPRYAVTAIISIWALLIIAVADRKYMIIPDQFVMMLAITAVGFVPFHGDFLAPLWGALLGGGFMFVIGFFGKLIFKKEALGFGDVKLLAAIGLMVGPMGVALILMASSFMSCLHFMVLMIMKKIKRTDVMPLGPYVALATTVYLIVI